MSNSSPLSDRSSSRRPAALIPWTFVALLIIVCAWLVQLCLALRAENILLRQQQALTDIELRSTQQHLEAERILNRHSAASKSADNASSPTP